MIRLAIVTSHPIQYNAPLFCELSQRSGIDVKVFYSWAGTTNKTDPEFGQKIAWDIPLLDGYDFQFVPNLSSNPGTDRFFGLNNPSMIECVKKWTPNMVLVYGWSSKTHLSVIRYFKGKIPVLFRGDSTLISGVGGLKGLMRMRALRWVYSYIDFAFYPGKRSQEYFLACGVPPDKLFWMPHSIENERFSVNNESIETDALKERARLSIRDNEIVFLFAGKLVKRKQPDLLMRSFMMLNREVQNIHLIFAGSGNLEFELRELSHGNKNIHFLGFQNQSSMPLTYRLGDTYVLPSSRETWGLGVNEAMACHRPVIVSDRVGCEADLVRGFPYGQVFKSEDVQDLKKAMVFMVNRHLDLKSLGFQAAASIKNWSTSNAADALLDSIKKI